MATTTSDTMWMPSPGPHQVTVGTSLNRALKARRGTVAPAKRSTFPDRELYSFRYNFKPESIDAAKPGTIEVRKGKETTSVTVERASTQRGEGQLFQGSEQPAKEWECVLIYDEESGTFTLEKLDSYIVLQYDKKTVMPSNRPSESPMPSGSTSPTKPAPTVAVAHDLDFEAQLERDLLSGLEDADGEPDDDFEEILPKQSTAEALKQEEEEASEHDVKISRPLVQPSSSRPKASPANAASRAASQSTVARPLATSITPKPGGASEKGKIKGLKREREQINADEEDLEFGRPAKISRPSPSLPARPVSPKGFALPTAPEPNVLALPSNGGSSSRPPPPVADSDSEDEWDEVPAEPVIQGAVTVTLAPANTLTIDRHNDTEEEEIDAFEAELNQQLGEDEDDDFLARAVSPEEVDSSHEVPMSLNQYAGGDVFGDEFDSSSSSEDSDD